MGRKNFMGRYERFYDKMYEDAEYANRGEKSAFEPVVLEFIRKYGIDSKAKCLEIGSGRGALQDVVENYTGVDLAKTVCKFYHKKFISASATELPFADETFDFVWTEAVLEHIPKIESALKEIARVTKPGGYVLLAPAWYCKEWYSWGGHVKKIEELSGKKKIIRMFIPFMSRPTVQFIGLFPGRIFALLKYKITKRPVKLFYKKLKANYDEYVGPDSDACNGLDPCLMAVWYESRGHKCVSHSSFFQKLFIRTENIGIQINKTVQNPALL